METFKDRIATIATALNIPAYIGSNNKIEIVRTGNMPRNLLTSFSVILANSRFTEIREKKKMRKSLVLTENEFGIAFLSDVIQINPFVSAIFGPFYVGSRNDEGLIDYLIKSESPLYEKEQIEKDVTYIPVLDDSIIQAWGRILTTLRDLQIVPYAKIAKFSAKERFSPSLPSNLDEDELKEKTVYTSYTFQREIYHLAKLGDRDGLKKLLLPRTDEDKKKAKSDSKQFLSDSTYMSLKRIKNLLISLNTILRLATEEGGAPPSTLHTVSEKAIERIDKASSEESLFPAIEYMIDSYTEALNNAFLQNHSINVVKVQKYILAHLNEKLTLDKLSQITGLAPAYLCRLFKNECRITINEYITKQKISSAMWMLESTDLPLLEIADKLGFENQTYFSQVFKKKMGITASQYRKNRGSLYRKDEPTLK